MVSFAVGIAPTTAEALEDSCKFCAEMGIPVFVWECNPAFADNLNELAAKYGITAAVHNHTWTTKAKDFEYRYWSPNFVWSVIKDRPHLAACADDGHWIRMNFDPSMNYRILHGRLAAIHFKNRSQWGMEGGRFTPLADGVLDAAAALRTLDELGYDGYFVLENESCKGAEIESAMKSDIKFLRQH
jgi:sugar phosphate isomerase/epimerase